MQRLIQDTIRKALADELLFGKLVNGGKVTVDVDDAEQVTLSFAEGAPPTAGGEGEEFVEVLPA
jgi:ATP-dependent Clp protease ATP-binding subunit ClpA